MTTDSKGTVKIRSFEESSVQRPHNTELVVDPHLAQWAVRTVTTTFAIMGSLLGIAIIVGGPERFSGISYTVALQLPGAPWSWGAIILACGLTTLTGVFVGRPGIAGIGMMLAGCWCLAFAIAFAISSFRYPTANTTAFFIYGSAAILCFIFAGVYLANRLHIGKG